MKMSEFEEISLLASECLDNADEDASNRLLLCFLEKLGYRHDLIISPGAYDFNSQVTFEYALMEDDKIAKAYLKIIPIEEGVNGYEEVIRESIVNQTHDLNNPRETFYIISNCFLYKIYSNIPGEQLSNLKELGTINIQSLTESDIELLERISIQPFERDVSLDYVDNDNEEDFDMKKFNEEIEEDKKEKLPLKIPELPKLEIKNKDTLKKIILIFMALIILFLVFKFYTCIFSLFSVFSIINSYFCFSANFYF